MGEFSTVDTAELVLGARFAGNYFGGEALALSTRLMQGVQWPAAIQAADKPTIYPVYDSFTAPAFGPFPRVPSSRANHRSHRCPPPSLSTSAPHRPPALTV